MQIQHDPAQQRFFVEADGQTAYLAYRPHGSQQLDFYRTFVPESLRRHGLALRLVQAGLDFAKQENKDVHPSCWYVEKVMNR